MSTRRQIAAYREILQTRHDEHMVKTYGMLPIPARFIGKCGCGRIFGEGSGWMPGTPCRFDRGDKIAKFRGTWWNLTCIDRVNREQFESSARYVREVRTREGWKPFDWSDDPKTAAVWRETLEIQPDERERVTDRQEAPQ